MYAFFLQNIFLSLGVGKRTPFFCGVPSISSWQSLSYRGFSLSPEPGKNKNEYIFYVQKMVSSQAKTGRIIEARLKTRAVKAITMGPSIFHSSPCHITKFSMILVDSWYGLFSILLYINFTFSGIVQRETFFITAPLTWSNYRIGNTKFNHLVLWASWKYYKDGSNIWRVFLLLDITFVVTLLLSLLWDLSEIRPNVAKYWWHLR